MQPLFAGKTVYFILDRLDIAGADSFTVAHPAGDRAIRKFENYILDSLHILKSTNRTWKMQPLFAEKTVYFILDRLDIAGELISSL